MVVVAGCANGPASPTSAGPAQAIISVGSRPGVPVAGEGAVWVPNTGDGTISRIDPTTNRVKATIKIGNQLAFYKRDCESKGSVHSYMVNSFHVRDCDLPSAIATGAGSLWVAKNDDQAVLRVDPKTQRILARIPVGIVPFDMAATDTSLWVTAYWADQLVRIDAKTNQVVARFTVPDGAGGLTVSDQAVWVTGTVAGTLTHIDPSTNQVVATIPIDCAGPCYVGTMPLPVLATGDAVWVQTEGDGKLVRVDPQTNRIVARLDVMFGPGRRGLDHMAYLDGSVWVSGDSLQRVDPQSNRVSGTIDVSTTSVISGFGSLWITDNRGRVERIIPSG
ncbi:MAG TPA: hypothetical protein VF003_15805 [Pseudonocardiaceae bacterium]